MNETATQPAQAVAAVDAAPAPRRRSLALRIIKLLLLSIVLLLVGRSLVHSLRQIPWEQVHISPALVGLAMLCLLLARVMTAMNCPHLLASLGARLPAGKVMPVIWVASLGRYIPGKVAVVAGATLMLVRLGARPPTAMAALFLSGALMILTGVIAATPLMFTPAIREFSPHAPAVSLAILCGGLLLLYPPLFIRVCNTALRLLKRQPLPPRMQVRPFLLAILITAVRMGFLGLALWLTARAVAPISPASFFLTLGAAGLASFAGFIAVFAPAGIGVHEAVYLATLQPLLGPQAALLVVLFRLLHVLADAIAGVAGLLMLRGRIEPVSSVAHAAVEKAVVRA